MNFNAGAGDEDLNLAVRRSQFKTESSKEAEELRLAKEASCASLAASSKEAEEIRLALALSLDTTTTTATTTSTTTGETKGETKGETNVTCSEIIYDAARSGKYDIIWLSLGSSGKNQDVCDPSIMDPDYVGMKYYYQQMPHRLQAAAVEGNRILVVLVNSSSWHGMHYRWSAFKNGAWEQLQSSDLLAVFKFVAGSWNSLPATTPRFCVRALDLRSSRARTNDTFLLRDIPSSAGPPGRRPSMR